MQADRAFEPEAYRDGVLADSVAVPSTVIVEVRGALHGWRNCIVSADVSLGVRYRE